jgi:ribonuclease BN (tRNA processing enzyme)
MRIITLGTSHGATERGRACSATLIEVEGAYYLFDCGGDVEPKMTNMGLPIESIRAVFISHMHEDHAGTLSSIAKRFTVYQPEESRVKMYLPEKRGIEAFRGWLSALHLPNLWKLSLLEVEEGEIYSDGRLRVFAIPTRHIEGGRYPSFAYVIEAEGKRLLYSGDLSGDFSDYPEVVNREDFDLIICELTHYEPERNFEAIKASRTKGLLFTHIWEGKIAPVLAKAPELPFKLDIATDGAEYVI